MRGIVLADEAGLRLALLDDERTLGSHSRLGHCRGRLDRLDDVHVAGTATDVPLDPFADLVVARIRVLPQQRSGAHQHPGRAVSALKRMVIRECLLQAVQLAF